MLLIRILLAVGAATSASLTDRDLVDVGWEERFDSQSVWRLESVAVPDGEHPPRFGPAVTNGVFEADQPGSVMTWTRTTTPIWIGAFPWLEVVYETPTTSTLVLGDDSTGPITPGALNMENPRASGGGLEIPLEAGASRIVVDLRGRVKTDRIARLSLQVRAGEKPVRVTLRRIAFHAADPQGEPATRVAATAPVRKQMLPPSSQPDSSDGDWLPIPLPDDRSVSAGTLAQALEAVPEWPAALDYRSAGVRFRLRPSAQACAATGVAPQEAIELTGEWHGSELALLLAARQFGSDSGWPGAALKRPSEDITSPHAMAVRLEYVDGSTWIGFPRPLLRDRESIARLPEPYRVPVDATKTLVRVSLRDEMSYGQLFLFGVSMGRSPAGTRSRPARVTGVPALAPASAPETASLQREGNSLQIETGAVRLEAECTFGFSVRALQLRRLNREVIDSTRPAESMIELKDATGRLIPLRLSELKAHASGDAAEVIAVWTPEGLAAVKVHLRVHIRGDQIVLGPSIENGGGEAIDLEVVCPRLGGCRVAERPADRWYLMGTRSSVLSNRTLKTEQPYGGAFPVQIVDLFTPSGGGLAMVVDDSSATPRTFVLEQTSESTQMGMRLPGVHVGAGSRLELPRAILLAHTGDWHEPLRLYRDCLRKRGLPPADRMRSLFFCRRDYPLGGTGYLFSPGHGQYTPAALIQESTECFGGLDMIDISGWAYHEATGRVGEYLTNDLGGLDELRRGIDAARDQGVKVGLYFEGYLIDRRAAIASKALPHWQILDASGKPKWWPGEMEFFACPGVEEWRGALSGMMAEVAAQTHAEAIYVDEFGFTDEAKQCWSRSHGHPVPSNPLLEECRMLEAIRSALDRRTPQTGVYIEQAPCEAMRRWVDGAFNYGTMPGTLPEHPVRLPLHRFVFPELALVEMVSEGIRPVPVSEDDLHRCIFHGLAIWLKGRGESWYSPGFRETARRAYPILRDHADVFRSPDCEPLIPTLAVDLYANRFRSGSRTIMTLYNASRQQISGDLLALPDGGGLIAKDLWNGGAALTRIENDRVTLGGTVEPRSVGVFLLSAP